MRDKLFILFRLFRDLSWKKKLLIFAILAFCISPMLPHEEDGGYVNVTEEHVVKGANDFIVPALYSEDNWEFKDKNNEDSFTAMDDSGSMLSIEKLNNIEEIKNSHAFTDCYTCVDGDV